LSVEASYDRRKIQSKDVYTRWPLLTVLCVINRVDESPFTETTHEREYGVLEFTDVTGAERGQYICTATNSAGTSSVTVDIIIRGAQEHDVVAEK